jgi:hypothetical protein
MARRQTRLQHWQPTGRFKTQVVGTSFFREGIASIAKNRPNESAFALFTARIVPERDNPADISAVAIYFDETNIGHLARATAPTYRSRLWAASGEYEATTVDAIIRNGQSFGDKTYEYTILLDLSEESTLSKYPFPTFPDVVRLDPRPPLIPQPDGSLLTTVWVGEVDRGDLHDRLYVDTWTTDSWQTVNFYVANRQQIGLGHKVFELDKNEFQRLFPSGISEARLLYPSDCWALLYVRRTEA